MNRIPNRIAVILSLCLSLNAWASGTVNIEGLVREKGTRKSLPQVNIYCFIGDNSEKPLKATTDSLGHFKIEVPEGKLRWVISVSNYLRFEKEDQQVLEKDIPVRDFFLEKTSYLTYETTVYGKEEKRDERTQSLDKAQFLTLPGANGDPVKAIQNLPGVNRSSFASSQVIIEGSSPNDTRYNINNQNVPIIFHFGGLSSVVIPEAVARVDYLSAGFGPEYGQSVAGFVNLTIKNPETDRLHGFAYVDLINTGGMIEGPLTDQSSFLLGIRQSYIGAVLGAVAGNNNKAFNYTAAPDFKDIVLEYRNLISSTDTFRISGVASKDTLGFLLKAPANQDPSIRGNFSSETDFFRIIPEWTHQVNSDVTSRLTLGLGKDWNFFNLSNYYLTNIQIAVTGRFELEDQITPSWKSFWGLDSQLYWTNLSFQLPVSTSRGGISNPLSGTSNRTVSNTYGIQEISFYWRNVIHAPDSPLTWNPGVRLSYLNLTNELIPLPRLAVKYALPGGWSLRGAAGLYDEAPLPQQLDSSYGNPNLTSQRATHGALGFEKDFRGESQQGWTVSSDVFYKYLYNTVAVSTAFLSPSQPEYYNNSGFGKIFGLELLAKYKSTGWNGWIAYTLSRGTGGNSQLAESLSQYDQTHLLTLVGDVELGRNWKFSSRVRYTTGNPITPVSSSILDIDNDTYIPVRGALYSDRLSPFFEIDIRLDKKWIYDHWILTAYLDIENVTNQMNPQQLSYSYNYQTSVAVSGLPFFPTLGIKGEF